jgi:hypothetical protein
MPIRAVKQHSDRGSIKDIQQGEEKLPPTDYELRLKNLYQHGVETRNQVLLDSLGFIPLEGAYNDPVSVYRLRERVNAISNKLAGKLAQTKSELESCFMPHFSMENAKNELKQLRATTIILGKEDFVKSASRNRANVVLRSFRREE